MRRCDLKPGTIFQYADSSGLYYYVGPKYPGGPYTGCDLSVSVGCVGDGDWHREVVVCWSPPEASSPTTFGWELVDTAGPQARRLPVPGGWLYQVKNGPVAGEWHPPVFVPAVGVVS